MFHLKITDMKQSIIAICLLLCAGAMYAQEAQTEAGPQQSAPQTVVVVRKESPAPIPAPKTYDWREHRQSVSFSVGLPSIYSTAFGSHSWEFYIPAPGNSTYRASDGVFTGAWAVDYGYNVLRWLRLGASANYECWTGANRTHDISAVARVDFTYINREHIRLYSGVAVGIGMHLMHFANGGLEGIYIPAANLTPIGLNFGNERVFGLVETNIGSASVLRIGIGFRP